MLPSVTAGLSLSRHERRDGVIERLRLLEARVLPRESEGATEPERADDGPLGNHGSSPMTHDAHRRIEARHVGISERAVVVEPEGARDEHLVAPSELLLRVVSDVDDLIVADLRRGELIRGAPDRACSRDEAETRRARPAENRVGVLRAEARRPVDRRAELVLGGRIELRRVDLRLRPLSWITVTSVATDVTNRMTSC